MILDRCLGRIYSCLAYWEITSDVGKKVGKTSGRMSFRSIIRTYATINFSTSLDTGRLFSICRDISTAIEERGRGRGGEWNRDKVWSEVEVDKGIYYRRGGRGLPNFSDYNIVFLYLAAWKPLAALLFGAGRSQPTRSFFLVGRFVGFREETLLEATSLTWSVVRVLILITFVWYTLPTVATGSIYIASSVANEWQKNVRVWISSIVLLLPLRRDCKC